MIELSFLHSALPLKALYQSIKFNLIPFYTFRNMLQTSFKLQKIKKGSNPVNTSDGVTVLAFCTSSDSPLSMYQVSFNSPLYFQRYAPHKLFLNTGARVIVFAIFNSPHGSLSVYQVSLNYLKYF